MYVLLSFIAAATMADAGSHLNRQDDSHQKTVVLDSARAVPEDPTPERGFALLFDHRSLTVLREATRVEVIRLRGEPADAAHPEMNDYFTARARKGDDQVAGFAVESLAVSADAKVVERLRALATSKASYHVYSGNKLCGGFQPKVVFRLWREVQGEKPDSVDLLLCFNCDDVGVVRAPSTRRGAKLVLDLADMGAARSEWLGVTRAALPDDPLFLRYDRKSQAK